MWWDLYGPTNPGATAKATTRKIASIDSKTLDAIIRTLSQILDLPNRGYPNGRPCTAWDTVIIIRGLCEIVQQYLDAHGAELSDDDRTDGSRRVA